MSTPNTPPIPSPNTLKWRGAGAVPKFRYVYHEAAETIGRVRQWSTTAEWLGVGVEDTVIGSTRVAGVTAEAMTAAGWGWIQTAGYCDYIVTDGNAIAPAADTLADDVVFRAAAAGAGCVPLSAAQAIAEMTTAADTMLPSSIFALNLAADVDTTNLGKVILVCAYQ